MEIDYVRKLSESDLQWLASFNEAEYGENPQCLEFITGQPTSQEDKRKAWREIQRYKRDTATCCGRVSGHGYESRQVSAEDGLNEWIDSEFRIERKALRFLKDFILAKYGRESQWPDIQDALSKRRRRKSRKTPT